ncbi:MAG: ankyrin repeat domain-containing protein, partial [Flavobacterium sp.]|nr:ankyrin repeat domain-containing protein [Flavobacterium sp.]
ALIYATMFKNIEIVTLLIKKNANPYLKDNRGNSALDYAILADNDKLIETLKTK